MTHPKHEKFITLAIVIGFSAQLVAFTLSTLIFPPDYSGDIPIYTPKSGVIVCLGIALSIVSSTVMAIKLADERKILGAAGFTSLAITMGVWMAALFELMQVNTLEAFEKSYYIVTSANFLYIPSLILIAATEEFKKWVRWLGVISSIPFMISSMLFLFDYHNFTVLDIISNIGYTMILFTQVIWAVNVYNNYRKKNLFVS